MKRIALSQGKYAKVDDADFGFLSQWNWVYAENTRGYGYAVGWVDKRNQRMHRFLLSAPNGLDVDHKNGDGLDNRRENIRICTRRQNQMNRKVQSISTSGIKGVFYAPKASAKNPWRAVIRINGKKTHLGLFPSKEEAGNAYAQATAKYHGEFAFDERNVDKSAV